MTHDELKQLATREDLQNLYERIKADILDLMNQDKKDFYSPKEFHSKTGMPYRTIIRHCNTGKLKAVQKIDGGSWLIYHSEIDRLIQEANQNKYA